MMMHTRALMILALLAGAESQDFSAPLESVDDDDVDITEESAPLDDDDVGDTPLESVDDDDVDITEEKFAGAETNALAQKEMVGKRPKVNPKGKQMVGGRKKRIHAVVHPSGLASQQEGNDVGPTRKEFIEKLTKMGIQEDEGQQMWTMHEKAGVGIPTTGSKMKSALVEGEEGKGATDIGSLINAFSRRRNTNQALQQDGNAVKNMEWQSSRPSNQNWAMITNDFSNYKIMSMANSKCLSSSMTLGSCNSYSWKKTTWTWSGSGHSFGEGYRFDNGGCVTITHLNSNAQKSSCSSSLLMMWIYSPGAQGAAGRPYVVQDTPLLANSRELRKSDCSTCRWGVLGAPPRTPTTGGLAAELLATVLQGSEDPLPGITGTPALEPHLPELLASALVQGEGWWKRGLDEHAAIGAFAKLCIELLVHGAPPGLVRLAIAAQEDELLHAHVALQLAGASRPKLEFPEHSVEFKRDISALHRAALHEGLEGEGTAAIDLFTQGMELLRRGQADAAKLVWAIARDEARHAQLAHEQLLWMHTNHGLPMPEVHFKGARLVATIATPATGVAGGGSDNVVV